MDAHDRNLTVQLTPAELFAAGNYQAVAESGATDQWQTHAALGLMGCGAGAAAAALDHFDCEEARFYSAVASWIDGDDTSAERGLADVSLPHARNLLHLLRRPQIDVLAQLWETRAGFWGLCDGISKDSRFRLRRVPTVPHADVHDLCDEAFSPDFYICAQSEWHLIPPNIQELKCPIFAQTGDPDMHVQIVQPWLRLFDEVITTSYDEWDDASKLSGVPASTFPKLFSIPVPQPHLNPFVPRTYDVTMTGAWCHPYQPEKARILQQVYRLPETQLMVFDGYLAPAHYTGLLAATKVVICFSRYTGCLPSRGLEALSMGCVPLIPNDNVWSFFVGETEGVFRYDPHGDDLPGVIARVLANWDDLQPYVRRGSDLVRREFCRTQVASQYMRYLTFLAAKPRPQAKRVPDAAPEQKRLVFWRGGFPGGAAVKNTLLKRFQDKWQAQGAPVSARGFIDMGRELTLVAAELDEQACLGESRGNAPELVAKVLRLYEIGLKMFPKSLVLRFNLVRVACHLGEPRQVTNALAVGLDTLAVPETDWQMDPMDDVFPYDFFSQCFNYRDYFDLVTLGLKNGDNVEPKLVQLILAALHNYLGQYEPEVGLFERAVELDPAFPLFKLNLATALLNRGNYDDLVKARSLLTELAEETWLFRQAYALLVYFWPDEVATAPDLKKVHLVAQRAQNSVSETPLHHPFDSWDSMHLRPREQKRQKAKSNGKIDARVVPQ